MPKRCPGCGQMNDDSRIFCSACGNPLDAQLRLIQDLEKQKKMPKVERAAPAPKAEEDYVAPAPKKKSGCYVATAVYGSYDCPQVWTLRRFRDNTLAESWYGRAFIRTYYAVSPTLVRWFGETKWFQKLWRGPLDRLVDRLQSEGVENTPYNDRPW